MSRRRLVPIALIVTALLAVVAIAARGRPLGKSGGKGAGLPVTFWEYVFTSLLIFVLVLFVLGLAALLLLRRERTEIPSYNRRTLRAVLIITLGVPVIFFIARHVNLQHLLHPTAPKTTLGKHPKGQNGGGHGATGSRHLQFRWDEFGVVVALLVGLGLYSAAGRRRLGPRMGRPDPEALAAALDESLDDIRADPDLRRAIVAAYARMETTLAAAGIPRDPAEAPLEYVERALLMLDTSADAVRRLTDLFVWARFSQHEPEPSMRDEAVDALIAVRDELRAAELTPA